MAWTNWLSAHCEPHCDCRPASSTGTYYKTNNFEWVITANEVTKEPVTISQTTYQETENFPEIKTMTRLRIKVET